MRVLTDPVRRGGVKGAPAASGGRRPRLLPSLWAVTLVSLTACSANLYFYEPDGVVYCTPRTLDIQVEVVHFRSPEGPQLHGWWLPASGSPTGTIVFCHGNTRNLTHHVEFIKWLPSCGYDVLIFDYRGYGRSEGTTSRSGTVADAIAALDFASLRDPERLIVLGHSLGGAIALAAVAERPGVRGVIVQSTWSSYRRMAASMVPGLSILVPLLVSTDHDPESVLAAIPPRPLLIIHGSEDRVVPIDLGRDLYEKAHHPKRFEKIDGGGHDMLPEVDPGAYRALVLGFIKNALKS